MSLGTIFSVKEFTLHDGPGVRTTVFFKGCPLRCQWCHNPEGLRMEPELMIQHARCTHCGKCTMGCVHPDCQGFDRCLHVCPNGLIQLCGERVEAEDLAARLLKNRVFFGQDGGITLSGGEPLMQGAFALALLRALRGVHRAVETSGHADMDTFAQVANEADLMIMDIKHVDPAQHMHYTGVDNARILRNLDQLKAMDRPFLIRVPLIPGVNDSAENLDATAALLQDCADRVRVELLPYNALAGAKYASVGRQYDDQTFDANKANAPDLSAFERLGIDCRVC